MERPAVIDIILDFESHYDGEYSLTKMPTMQYIRDARWQCKGCGVQIQNDAPVYVQPDRLPELFDQLPWSQVRVIAHNASFDLAVLSERYGKFPAASIDTQHVAQYAVAQGQLPPSQRVSLAALAPLVGMVKGDTDEAVGAGGQALVDYGLQDVRIERALLDHLPPLPALEQETSELIVRMATRPRLELDVDLLESIGEEQPPPEAMLLRSKDNFAAALRALGVEPATKPGKKGPQFAFAKADAFMRELLESDDDMVRVLAELRVYGQSNIERTRAQRMLSNGSPAPIPLAYYAAHTGRHGGRDKLNYQNLPARMGVPRLRKALLAPEGYKLVVVDSSQIEVRVLAWLAGDQALLDEFRHGVDPYRAFGATLYGCEPEQVTGRQRTVAKAAVLALGFGQGAAGFLAYCGRFGVAIGQAEAQRAVEVYRAKRHRVVAHWHRLENHVRAQRERELPSGRKLVYNGFALDNGEMSWERPRIFQKRKEAVRDKLWHGKLVENEVQAVARDVVFGQTNLLGRRWDVVLSLHDEAVLVVPEDAVDEAVRHCHAAFTTPPLWAPDIPLGCEVKVGNNYGVKE